MADPTTPAGDPAPLTDDRVRSMGRLLIVALVLAAVLALASVPMLAGGYARYGSIVLGIAVVLGVLAGLSLRRTRRRDPAARRLTIVTGVVMVVLSVPLVPIWIGLLTVVAGIGLLVVTVAPEKES
jgi:peptidoglycan/LPS O-acetylase OafA/YrhL